MLEHLNKLLQIPGSKLLFGGEPLKKHSIPSIYGAIKPTAVYVPLEEIMKENTYELVTREIFGPFQVYKKGLFQCNFFCFEFWCITKFYSTFYAKLFVITYKCPEYIGSQHF